MARCEVARIAPLRGGPHPGIRLHPRSPGSSQQQQHGFRTDAAREFLGPRERSGFAAIVEDERMQIAIPGVEDIGHAQARRAGH